MQLLSLEKEIEGTMPARCVDEDRDLGEMLLQGPEAFGALALGRNAPMNAATPAAMARWLRAPRTVILFRTIKWATFAGLQIARRGYVAATFQKYLIVQAPWLLVCAIVGRVGAGQEVLNIRWENEGPWGWTTEEADRSR